MVRSRDKFHLFAQSVRLVGKLHKVVAWLDVVFARQTCLEIYDSPVKWHRVNPWVGNAYISRVSIYAAACLFMVARIGENRRCGSCRCNAVADRCRCGAITGSQAAKHAREESIREIVAKETYYAANALPVNANRAMWRGRNVRDRANVPKIYRYKFCFGLSKRFNRSVPHSIAYTGCPENWLENPSPRVSKRKVLSKISDDNRWRAASWKTGGRLDAAKNRL